MADTPVPTEGLTPEQKLGLALVSLMTPLAGYAMGGKDGAMVGAQSGFTAAGGAAGDIGKQQREGKKTREAAEAAEQKYQRTRKDKIEDAPKIAGAVEAAKQKAKPEKVEKPPRVQQTTFTDEHGKPLIFDPGSGTYKAAEAPTGAKRASAEPKDVQFSAATYGRRMEQSEQVFDSLVKKGYNRADYKESALSAVLSGTGLEAIKDPDLKMQAQAERNFVNAVLRKESGAAISPTEFKSAEAQYFPRAGDTPEVLAQKKANRQQVIEGLKASSGGAWERVPLVDATPAAAGPATTPPPPPKPKQVIQDGVTYTLNETTGEYE